MEQKIAEIESKDGVRCVFNIIPIKPLEILPITVLYTPYMPLSTDMSLLEYEPVCCFSCRSVLNPYCEINYVSRTWTCIFCQKVTNLPPHYRDVQPESLPMEMYDTTVEYVHQRPGPPPVYVLVVDTCTFDDIRHVLLQDAVRLTLALLPRDSLVCLIHYGTNIEVLVTSRGEIRRKYLYSGKKTYTRESLSKKERGGHKAEESKTGTSFKAGVQQGPQSPFAPFASEFFTPLSDLCYDPSEIKSDPFPVINGSRPLRCTGSAISLASSLLEPETGAKILLFTQGPCTFGPGAVSSLLLKEGIRSHSDIVKGKALYVKAAQTFYTELGTRLATQGHSLDILSATIEDVGLYEMRPLSDLTGGMIIMAQDFDREIYLSSIRKYFCSKNIDHNVDDMKDGDIKYGSMRDGDIKYGGNIKDGSMRDGDINDVEYSNVEHSNERNNEHSIKHSSIKNSNERNNDQHNNDQHNNDQHNNDQHNNDQHTIKNSSIKNSSIKNSNEHSSIKHGSIRHGSTKYKTDVDGLTKDLSSINLELQSGNANYSSNRNNEELSMYNNSGKEEESENINISPTTTLNAKIKILTSPNLTYKGVLGQGVSFLTGWRVNSLHSSTTLALLFDPVNARSKDFCYIQVITQSHRQSKIFSRVTTLSRTFNESIEKVSLGFDQEAGCVLQARMYTFLNQFEEDIDLVRRIDRGLIRFVRKFSSFTKEDVSPVSLPESMHYFPNFIYFLRRSVVVQSEGNSPDETSYYRGILGRERVTEGMTMIVPVLTQYHYETGIGPVEMDSKSLLPDSVLLLDAFSHVLIWRGEHVVEWVKEDLHNQEEYVALKECLDESTKRAREIVDARVPTPQFVETQAGGSQERTLLSRVNPSRQGALIVTEDIDYETFYRYLCKIIVES